MGVPNVDATTKFLVLSHHVDQHCLPANTEFIHVVQPLSFSTRTNNLLGENIPCNRIFHTIRIGNACSSWVSLFNRSRGSNVM